MSVETQLVSFGTAITSARMFLAVVFLGAGVPKLFAGEALASSVRALGIGGRGVGALRIGVPVAETALGIWLLTDTHPVAAALAAASLLAVFTYALIELRRHEAGSCACFVWDDGSVGVRHVVRNLGLAALATLIGIATLVGWYAWEPVWRMPKQVLWTAVGVVVVALLVCALLAKSLQFARYGVVGS